MGDAVELLAEAGIPGLASGIQGLDQAEANALIAQAWSPDTPIDPAADVSAVATWYIAADAAWVAAAMPSGTMTRSQFLDQWQGEQP